MRWKKLFNPRYEINKRMRAKSLVIMIEKVTSEKKVSSILDASIAKADVKSC